MLTNDVMFRVAGADDGGRVVDFLMSLGEELYLGERRVAEEIVARLFAHGFMSIGEKGKQVVAMSGVLLGEPAKDYVNREVGFIYVAGLAKRYRGQGVFQVGLEFLIEEMVARGLERFRLHVLMTDKRLQGIYGRFARPLREELNPRGMACILYEGNVAQVWAGMKKKKVPAYAYNATPHAYVLPRYDGEYL